MATKKCKLINFMVVFSVSTFGLVHASGWVYDDTGCRTPDGGVGDCIVVRGCKNMMNFLEQTTITQNIISVLRSYQCGVEGKSVKICCPHKPITIKIPGGNNGDTSTYKPPIATTYPLPPDVSNHRNIHLLPSATDCGPLSLRNRITNGNKTALYEFPWMTLLSYKKRTTVEFGCGGTLINDRYVLTAAHCLANLGSSMLLGVRLGEYNISSSQDCERVDINTTICAEPVQDRYVEEIIPHPDYKAGSINNDIGLVRLSSPVKFNEGVQPICLPISETMRNKNFTNEKLIVTGWGATGRYVRQSDDLLKVEIPIIPETECQEVYDRKTKNKFKITFKQLCAGGKSGKDSCNGDSGGPLQAGEVIDVDIHYVQYGIVSFGPSDCGEEGFPGVYTRINYYMDWILDNIRV